MTNNFKHETMKHTPGNWKYKMFLSQKIKFSCFITAQNGDNICKMLRDDAPNNSIQEANAKLIAAAPELLKELSLASNFLKVYVKNLPENDHFAQAMQAGIISMDLTIKKATE